MVTSATVVKKRSRKGVIYNLIKYRYLYMLLFPGLLYFLVFKYYPMWGVLLAFKNYQPFLGFWHSQWVGMQNFNQLFTNFEFLQLIRNTLLLSLYNIVFFFPAPIIIALLLNEMRKLWFRKALQTAIYLPHFISIVVVVGITFDVLTTNGGVVNHILQQVFGTQIDFLSSPIWFRPIITLQTMWKETGWSTILFLAALSNVDVELYDAARVDGAGRWRQMWHVTLPSIRSTIVILLILRMGAILNSGFEQIYLMTNSLNQNVANVFDTYVYFVGLTQGSFSYATAVGLFKAVVGAILIFGSNYLAKRFGESGIF
ncbi:ABC transporter permease [Alicyclobacillus fodiniaquatilis]|uniref:ABC transporter permease n=1 Tax=Alicyclobacillus fodiniaquatilis TaxID=1661150 RepID=A0ABW4JEI9_9BACL